jgi:hypothetical protein
MSGVTTIALLERKPTISRSLFTRYWRDVHGVMAARIPGFDSYTQHHVTPVEGNSEPFEGIAIVTYLCEADRAGLIESAITRHIHRDEQNLFRRALLYNLAPGASRTVSGARGTGDLLFLVLPEGVAAAPLLEDLARCGPSLLVTHDLASGDPAGWNDTDVDEGGTSRRFAMLIESQWATREEALIGAGRASDASEGAVAAYLVDETHVMVENGVPTPVGLRGLDAVKTILEAGADNQLQPDVVRAIYGAVAAR